MKRERNDWLAELLCSDGYHCWAEQRHLLPLAELLFLPLPSLFHTCWGFPLHTTRSPHYEALSVRYQCAVVVVVGENAPIELALFVEPHLNHEADDFVFWAYARFHSPQNRLHIPTEHYETAKMTATQKPCERSVVMNLHEAFLLMLYFGVWARLIWSCSTRGWTPPFQEQPP